MQVNLPSYPAFIALLFILALLPCRAWALSIDVTPLGNDRFQVVIDDVPGIDGPVFTLDRTTGEVVFGDGLAGRRPPSGRSGILGAYRFGGGGSIFNEFDLLNAGFPLPISVAALLDPKGEDEDINFVLAGVRALKFELTAEELTLLSAELTAIPLPGSLGLMFSALAVLGIAGYRNKATVSAQ